jgi:transcriptional regulator with XRE-family HTH domain
MKHQSNFSQNLIRLRKEKGLSQQKLADLTGLTQRKIVYYETKAVKPPIDSIEVIAKSLNVSINKLLGTNESTNIQKEFSNLDARTIRKIKLILSLPNEDRHMIYTLAELLANKKKLLQGSK